MPRNTATDSLKTPTGGPERIVVPHLFSPRSYQRPPMAYIDEGGKRAVDVSHRRSGKDIKWLNQMIKMMVRMPFCGTYIYLFPKLIQGRRDLWDAKTSPDSGGRPFRAHFPPSLVMESSETEMQITLRPMPHQNPQPISDGRGGQKFVGSIFQVMGTDKESVENIRGINAAGVVFSEFSEQDPTAWYSIIEPVLAESGGWAAFNLTPKGKNHAYDMYTYALSDPDWYVNLLTIDDTQRDGPGEDGSRVVSQEFIDGLRRRGVPEEIIQQEYYCSFEGFLQGSIYGDLLKKCEADGRIGNVPWMSTLPVGTMWDIGRTDSTAIWFYQCVGSEIRFIDYYANQRQGAEHYVKVIREKPYLYGRVTLPHDARTKGYTATESTEEFLGRTVNREVRIAERLSVQTGIDMTRRMFSRFYFDAGNCDRIPNPGLPSGLQSLKSYHRVWNEALGDYSGEPLHDKHSHGADSLRTGCVGWQEGLHFQQDYEKPVIVINEFDPRETMNPQRGQPEDQIIGQPIQLP